MPVSKMDATVRSMLERIAEDHSATVVTITISPFRRENSKTREGGLASRPNVAVTIIFGSFVTVRLSLSVGPDVCRTAAGALGASVWWSVSSKFALPIFSSSHRRTG